MKDKWALEWIILRTAGLYGLRVKNMRHHYFHYINYFLKDIVRLADKWVLLISIELEKDLKFYL